MQKYNTLASSINQHKSPGVYGSHNLKPGIMNPSFLQANGRLHLHEASIQQLEAIEPSMSQKNLERQNSMAASTNFYMAIE